MNLPRIFLGFLLSFLIVPTLFAETVHVKRVIDGDTVVLADDTRVRLIGIDAPEIENRDYGHRGEPYGEEAKRILKGLVENKDVELQDGPQKKDKYERRLAYLYLGTLFINQNLVETGVAAAYRKFDHPYRSEFIQIENQARQKKIGMWAVEKRTPNWWQRLFGLRS